MRNIIYVVLMLFLLGTVTSVVAVNFVSLDRSSTLPISETTDSNQQPLLSITEFGPYAGGTENQEFVEVSNNYDEVQTVTVDLSTAEFDFSDGTEIKTITLQSSESRTLYIDTGGPTRSCTEVDNRRQSNYSFESTSNTLTVNETESTVSVCRQGRGQGGGQGGQDGTPPGQR